MPTLFQHILVPVDFTAKNLAALNVSRTLAEREQGRVTLLHVIETIDYEADEEIERFYATLREQSKVKLREFAAHYQSEEISVECVIRMGKRTGTILNYAMENQIDLVVMSSHKVKLEGSPKGWGTVSHQVSILAQCPVLLVK